MAAQRDHRASGLVLMPFWLTAFVSELRHIAPIASLPAIEQGMALELVLLLFAIAVLSVVAVVDERRASEARVRDRERLLALTTSATDVGLWSADLKSGAVWVDVRFARMVGLSSATQVSRCEEMTQRMHPEDRERVLESFRRARADSAPSDEWGTYRHWESVARVEHDDGTTHWILSRATLLRNEDGTPYRATGIGIDITEQHRAGQALRESDERMALAAATANVGLWSIDVATEELWVSEHCHKLLGLLPRTSEPRAPSEAFVQAVAFGGSVEHMDRALTSRPVLHREIAVVDADGTERWVASAARRLAASADGHSARIVGVLRDITEERRAEQAARERQQELVHLARVAMIGEMSATIVHEIGQPTGAVTLNAQAARRLLDGKETDREVLRDIVDDIVRDSQRTADVLAQLRRLLRRDEIEREPLDIGEVVREALDLAHSELSRQDIEVDLGVSEGVLSVVGNKSQLQQVLLNVILNARDAMSEVPVERRSLRVGVHRGEGATVHVSVADSGGGISADQMNRVFEPFFTSKTHGLGLGLAISRSIMVEHGGSLHAAQNADGGAVLQLTLPAATRESELPRLKPGRDRVNSEGPIAFATDDGRFGR